MTGTVPNNSSFTIISVNSNKIAVKEPTDYEAAGKEVTIDVDLREKAFTGIFTYPDEQIQMVTGLQMKKKLLVYSVAAIQLILLSTSNTGRKIPVSGKRAPSTSFLPLTVPTKTLTIPE